MLLLDRMGRRAELCGAMMHRLNIDPVQASRMALGTMMQGIVRTCMLCRRTEECARWLGSHPPADAKGYRRFCPNAQKFDGTLGYVAFCSGTPESVASKTE
jgi:Family of unknown function (DUF6455)